eukprot:555551-Hanusia_phi.AAC.1
MINESQWSRRRILLSDPIFKAAKSKPREVGRSRARVSDPPGQCVVPACVRAGPPRPGRRPAPGPLTGQVIQHAIHRRHIQV